MPRIRTCFQSEDWRTHRWAFKGINKPAVHTSSVQRGARCLKGTLGDRVEARSIGEDDLLPCFGSDTIRAEFEATSTDCDGLEGTGRARCRGRACCSAAAGRVRTTAIAILRVGYRRENGEKREKRSHLAVGSEMYRFKRCDFCSRKRRRKCDRSKQRIRREWRKPKVWGGYNLDRTAWQQASLASQSTDS
jgi:hypothetical protein